MPEPRWPDFDVNYYAPPSQRREPTSSRVWKLASLGFTLTLMWSGFAGSIVLDLWRRRNRSR